MSRDPADDRLAELTRLAGGLAHEIKNPLSTMNINLQLLREDWARESGPVASRSVAKIDVLMHEARRLERMLADFLRLVSPNELDLATQDLGLVIEEVLAFLTPELSKRGVQVTSQLDRGLNAVVLDRNQFKQAFLNLVKNAAEAMDERGGTLTIQTSREGDQAVVNVIDTGPGMKAETRARIFQAYFSTKADGTGLGLSMVRRIVERHDGTVSCESEIGRGTRFRIAIPVVGPRPRTGEG
ncbi:MAG: ATP-binding protein [Planctomycetota bacterium]